MSLPPFSLSQKMIQDLSDKTKLVAKELKIVGLMNVQYAIKDNEIYCLEVNPRASRTVPFVSKAIGVPLAKLAAKVMAGRKLKDLGFTKEIVPPYWAIKESVFPFVKFPGVDIILSPEMKSTGEVMGIDEDFGIAYFKSQQAAFSQIPDSGKVFISVKTEDKPKVLPIAKDFIELGYTLVATPGTARYLQEHGIRTEVVKKIIEGRPNVTDHIRNKEIKLIINTPTGKGPKLDEAKIRSLAVSFGISCITTLNAAKATIQGIQSYRKHGISVKTIQEYHKIISKLGLKLRTVAGKLN